MTKERWSLERYATPDNPYGMNLRRSSGHLVGRDKDTEVETSVGNINVDGSRVHARRTDKEPIGFRRLIKKTFGLPIGEVVKNPHPYDLVSIWRYGRQNMNRLDLGSQVSRQWVLEQRFRSTEQQMSGEVPFDQEPIVPVVLSTTLHCQREVYLREYAFRAAYRPTPVGSTELAPLDNIEFTINPTRMEIDGWEFPIEVSGPINFLEVDNYVAGRGIATNLNEVKQLLTDPNIQADAEVGEGIGYKIRFEREFRYGSVI